MDIFKQLSSGADVDMAKPEYAEAIKEIALLIDGGVIASIRTGEYKLG